MLRVDGDHSRKDPGFTAATGPRRPLAVGVGAHGCDGGHDRCFARPRFRAVVRRSGAPFSRVQHAGDGLRHRDRDTRLHARHAPRLRRRPHRRHRQHDTKADERGQAAYQRRLLLLARALVGRLRACGPAELRHPGARLAGEERQVRSAPDHEHRRDVGVGFLPLSDRGTQHRHPRVHRAACSRRCGRGSTTTRSSRSS